MGSENTGGDGGGQDGATGSIDNLMGGGTGGDTGGGDTGGTSGGDTGNNGGDTSNTGGADPDWYSSLSAEVGEGQSASNLDVVKAKNWQSVDDIVKGYREAERALRDGGRVKVPGEGASAEEIAAYHKAIGVPEDAKGYEIPQPKDADDNPIEINTALAERIAASAHKHGVPKAALDALLAEEIDVQIAEYDKLVQAQQKAAGEHVKSWGEDRDNMMAQVNAAAKEAGLTQADMEYLRGMPSGAGKALDMLAKFGSNFTEDSLVRGQSRTFGMNAEQAQAEIDAIKGDPDLRAKAMVPNSAEYQRYNRALEALSAAADKAAQAA